MAQGANEPPQQHSSSGPSQQRQKQNRVPKSYKTLWIALSVLCVFCAVLYQCIPDPTPPVPAFNVVNVFKKNMEKVKASFPGQRPELWSQSQKHIIFHLKTVNPTEPVSLILTSGRGAERTLGCLAHQLAGAFSTVFNSSVLDIDGKTKESQDSDQVKLDIDMELRKAFGGEKLSAVIHRFEELPPGSALIFYRYCDHENAAFKNVFLIFTVIIDAQEEIQSSVSLPIVEDMVYKLLKQKFVSSDKPAVFNEMDMDKLSGLWSRISHLILPVVEEAEIGQLGCGSDGKSF